MDRAGRGGNINVRFGAPLAQPPRRGLRRSALCCQSLPPGDCLLAQRICRTAGELSGPAVTAVRAESCGGGSEGDCAPGAGAGGGVADECSSGSDGPLLDGAAAFVLRLEAALAPRAFHRSSRGLAGCIVVGVLSASSDLRTALDRYRPGRVGRSAAGGMRRGWREPQRELWTALVGWAVACSLLMFPVSAPMWKILPKMHFMQI